MLYRKLRIALVCTPLPTPYWSYGDHWLDGFKDTGCDVVRFNYDQIPHLPVGFDLYFFVEIRYNPYSIPWFVSPRVLYSWDSHVAGTNVYEPCHECFDYIYLASKIDTEVLNSKGLPKFKWLPEACNPHIHKDLGIPRQYDIGYIGHNNFNMIRNDKSKNDFLTHLKEKYGDRYYYNIDVYGEQYCKEQNKINIMFDRTIAYNVGTRIFESCASGCIPLWSNARYKNGIDQLFQEGLHYIEYNDTIEDLDNKIEWALNNPEILNNMRHVSKIHVLENHTYGNRALSVLKDNIKEMYSFGVV